MTGGCARAAITDLATWDPTSCTRPAIIADDIAKIQATVLMVKRFWSAHRVYWLSGLRLR